MTRRRLAAVAAMVLSGGAVHAQPAPADSAARTAVRAVVSRYLHGLKFNDTTGFHDAFRPDARLFWVRRDGTLGQLTQADWYRGFAASAGKEEPGDLRIDRVDVTDDAASVKVVEVYPKEIYVDYLNLLRIGNEWRIVNKIYTRRAR